MACSAERETRCISSESKMLTGKIFIDTNYLKTGTNLLQIKVFILKLPIQKLTHLYSDFDRHFRASSSALDEIPLESQQLPGACEPAAYTKATIAPRVPIKIDLHQRRVSAGGNPLAFVIPTSD